jgi:hypothetical protein
MLRLPRQMAVNHVTISAKTSDIWHLPADLLG